jgi:acetylornithine deacetylase/succinyl-diaminopimelate desuccinylase-like protein
LRSRWIGSRAISALTRRTLRAKSLGPSSFFAEIFEEAGVDYETAESAPGRGNIWARLEGGDEPGVVLLHHTDVVPATAAAWNSDPFEPTVVDGVLFGRGALDTKSLGIMHLEAFLALHDSGRPLNRDVIFMATADEEAGGMFGAGWLVENRPEVFEDVGFLLNEGGRGVRAQAGSYFVIEVAQKRPFWLRLTSTDEPGHGSRPFADVRDHAAHRSSAADSGAAIRSPGDTPGAADVRGNFRVFRPPVERLDGEHRCCYSGSRFPE